MIRRGRWTAFFFFFFGGDGGEYSEAVSEESSDSLSSVAHSVLLVKVCKIIE